MPRDRDGRFAVSVRCFRLLFPFAVSVRCFRSLFPFAVSVRCFRSLFPFAVPVRCFRSLFPFAVSVRCFRSLFPFAVSVRCSRLLREGKSSNAEVDYVIQHGFNIIPIEVKAGSSGSLKSLHTFMAEKSFKYAVRFEINLPLVQDIRAKTLISKGELTNAQYKLFNLPLYFAGFIF